MMPEYLFAPVPPRQYRQRAAPWLTTLAVLGIFLFGFIGVRMHQHTSYNPDDKDTVLQSKLLGLHLYSIRYEKFVAPQLDAIIAGGEVGSDLAWVGLFAADPDNPDDVQFARNVWLRINPEMAEAILLAYDWDDRTEAALQLDKPSRIAALTAMRDEDILSTLRAAEARGEQRLLAELDAQRSAYLVALWGRWIALALSLLCLVLAFWIPDRTIRRIADEQTDYDVAMKEYRAAMAAAGRPLPDDRPEPDLVVQPPA